MTETNLATDSGKREVVISRIFNASRELMWKAWTDPRIFRKWWGPKEFTSPFAKIDFRVGGKYLHCMRTPDGKDYWSTGTYEEIVPMERIVFTDSFSDNKGNVVPSTYYGMSNFPLEMFVTITFEDHSPDDGGKTKMTLIHSGTENIGDKDLSNMQQGWNQSFDKLAKSLKQIN